MRGKKNNKKTKKNYWLGKVAKASKERLWSLQKGKEGETTDVVKKEGLSLRLLLRRK